MKRADIAILILSFDDFKVTWKPCIDHLFSAWPDCPYPVYLLNNFITSEDTRVKNLLVGEDLNWSDTLKNGLLKIENKRIFFIYDDAFITTLDTEAVELIFMTAIENNLDSVALRRRKFDKGETFNKNLYKINSTAKYRNSLFLNLIKKDVVLSLLRSGENNWQFEKDGNIRSKELNFYSVYDRKIATYHHGVIKGKWMPKVYKYLKNKGYSLNDKKLKKHSKFRAFTMDVYEIIFNSYHKFTHLFK